MQLRNFDALSCPSPNGASRYVPVMKPVMKIAFAIGIICLLVGGALLWGPTRKFMRQDSCLDAGGKWASNGDFCIYQNCAESGSCLPSYRNNQVCNTLKEGISLEEVSLHLGMPLKSSDTTYFFAGGGAQSQIEITVENGKVTRLNCGT